MVSHRQPPPPENLQCLCGKKPNLDVQFNSNLLIGHPCRIIFDTPRRTYNLPILPYCNTNYQRDVRRRLDDCVGIVRAYRRELNETRLLPNCTCLVGLAKLLGQIPSRDICYQIFTLEGETHYLRYAAASTPHGHFAMMYLLGASKCVMLPCVFLLLRHAPNGALRVQTLMQPLWVYGHHVTMVWG